MHMLRIVLLGWPCITSSAWILLWIYLQTSNAFKPILLLYVLQPTVVDKQQAHGERKRQEEEANKRLCWDCVPGFLWECVAFLLLTAKQHFVTDCLKSLNLRWMHHLPNCRNAICVFLHCYFVVVWLAFLEREIRKRDIHKTDSPPHPLLIITCEKKLELRVEWRKTAGQAQAMS